MDQLSNVAINRPVKQSSTSTWSISKNPEIDARVANNGDLISRQYFHTSAEINPWWQVELDGVFVVERVSLYNRLDARDRLKRFTILRSSNEKDWFPIYRKFDSASFDELSVDIEEAGLAKFIRVRLDGYNFLHFRECQVFGRRPDEEERRQLQAQDVDMLDERSRVPQGRKGHFASIGAFSIFVDDENYGKNVRNALESGRYESRERELVAKFVRNSDKVIEIGTAVGAVSMTAASIVGPQNVTTFDANPYIIADARANFARNGLDYIISHAAVLACRKNFTDDSSTADFYISKEFWASRLYVGKSASDIVETIKVEIKCLEDEIETHKANVLICDIEGGEVELLSDADLSCIRLIIIETHYWAVGEMPTDKLINKLISQGFYLHIGASGEGVAVLRRL